MAYLHGQGLAAIVNAVNTYQIIKKKKISWEIGSDDLGDLGMGNIKINCIEIEHRMWSGFNWPLWPCQEKTVS